jgi:hypothetical protein
MAGAAPTCEGSVRLAEGMESPPGARQTGRAWRCAGEELSSSDEGSWDSSAGLSAQISGFLGPPAGINALSNARIVRRNGGKDMDATAVVIIVVAVVVIALVAIGMLMARRHQRAQLQQQFGPEWDRAVQAKGGPKAAEADLRDRVGRRKALALKPLQPADRDRYQQEWRRVQAEFVDQPAASLTLADGLVSRVMHDSGYPMDDFESQADLISVDHPDVVEHYRRAHGVSVDNQAGRASTEDMRQAFISYRALFAQFLGADSRADLGRDTPVK